MFLGGARIIEDMRSSLSAFFTSLRRRLPRRSARRRRLLLLARARFRRTRRGRRRDRASFCCCFLCRGLLATLLLRLVERLSPLDSAGAKFSSLSCFGIAGCRSSGGSSCGSSFFFGGALFRCMRRSTVAADVAWWSNPPLRLLLPRNLPRNDWNLRQYRQRGSNPSWRRRDVVRGHLRQFVAEEVRRAS